MGINLSLHVVTVLGRDVDEGFCCHTFTTADLTDRRAIYDFFFAAETDVN